MVPFAGDGQVTIIGCGARDWDDCATVALTLEPIRNAHPLLTVIEGAAPGADTCVGDWAASVRQRGVHWIRIRARWEDYSRATRWKAGHDRNAAMCAMLLAARDGHNHTVATVAFKHALDERLWIKPDTATGGTEDMIRRSWAANVPVWHIPGHHHEPRRLEPPDPF